MKRLSVIMAITAVVSTASFAQTTSPDSVTEKLGEMLNKIFNSDIQMDVDTTLFDSKQNNFYFSETKKAMIMTLLAPQSFDKAEEHFSKEADKDGYKMLEKKKFSHNGKNVLFQRGVLKRDGNKAYMYSYAIECGPTSVIFITGMHMEGDEKEYRPAIERAALSASLTK